MKLTASHPIRELVRILLRPLRRVLAPTPLEVVQANDREAFEYFYAQEDYIARHYLEPARLALYEFVAEYCAGVPEAAETGDVVRIVDMGCGMGHLLEALRRRFAPRYRLELLGLDFAATAIDKSRALLPGATFLVEDIYHNSLPSESFDLVVSVETLEHLRFPEKALAELRRICKPRGSIVLTVPNGEKDTWKGHVNFWSLSQFREWLSPYGLADIRLIADEMLILARLSK